MQSQFVISPKIALMRDVAFNDDDIHRILIETTPPTSSINRSILISHNYIYVIQTWHYMYYNNYSS